MAVDTTRDALDTLLQRLLLGDKVAFGGSPERYEYDYAFDRAAHLLAAKAEQIDSYRFQMRLRLAMHLAPASAIAYVGTNPRPRHALIIEFLRSEFGRDGEAVDRLARDVAKVLIAWDEQREAVFSLSPVLLRRQGGRCAHCHVQLSGPGDVWTLKSMDEFKPYHLAPDELLSPEVDHIEAVSCLGTNDLSNLQVLCRLCNAGKGDGLGLDVRLELEYAGTPVPLIDRIHRCRMVYHVIGRAHRACSSCRSTGRELTMRMIRPGGGFVRSNLAALCAVCIEKGPTKVNSKADEGAVFAEP